MGSISITPTIYGIHTLVVNQYLTLSKVDSVIYGRALSSQIQSGSTGIGYVGTQAGIAFLLSMIQGQGPPLSPIPGIDRFAGIMAGLSVLLVITLAVSLFRLPRASTAPAHGD
jgi:hypothetical protein